MRVEDIWTEDERTEREKLTIVVDGKAVFSVQDDEPEDARLLRSFKDCEKIVDLMRQAHAAGVRGEPFEVVDDGAVMPARPGALEPWQQALEKAIQEGEARSPPVGPPCLQQVAHCDPTFFTTTSKVPKAYDTRLWRGHRQPELVRILWPLEALVRIVQQKTKWAKIRDPEVYLHFWPNCPSDSPTMTWLDGKLLLIANDIRREVQADAFLAHLHRVASAHVIRGGGP